MAVISVEALRLDLAEANKLQDEATRKRVKDILLIESEKIQADIKHLEESTKDKEAGGESVPLKIKISSRPLKVITTYGWDQSEKFMKLYITLNGVQNIPKENVKCDFTESGFELLVSDLDKKDHKVLITRLMESILPEGSYFKVKTDMVLLMLKKEKAGKTWPVVTKKDDSKSKSDSGDERPPPPAQAAGGAGGAGGQDGMMDMLKKMYDEGDDEMKRTISKAMSENQAGGGGGGGMPGMPGMGGMGGAGGMGGMGGLAGMMGGMGGMGGMPGMEGMGGMGGMPGMEGLGGMGGMPGMGGAGGAPGMDGLGGMAGMPDMASLLSGLGGMGGLGGGVGGGVEGGVDGTGSAEGV